MTPWQLFGYPCGSYAVRRTVTFYNGMHSVVIRAECRRMDADKDTEKENKSLHGPLQRKVS